MRRLVLWDVDGTLLRAGAASREPFQDAVAAVLQRELVEGLHDKIIMSGKTDPQIARELLLLAEVDDPEVDGHLPAVLRALEAQLLASEERIRTEGRVMPGVVPLLERLADHADVVQSVLTGNLAGNAVVKLRALGLDGWLDLEIGAYGSDHHDREELVPIAVSKAAARHGRTFSAHEVWVIGDTPRDLACAKAGGANCLLVATGQFARDELEGLGADAVLDDLTDTEEVLAVLAS